MDMPLSAEVPSEPGSLVGDLGRSTIGAGGSSGSAIAATQDFDVDMEQVASRCGYRWGVGGLTPDRAHSRFGGML